MRSWPQIVFVFLALAGVVPAIAADAEWQFRVLLDGKEIGTHTFTVVQEGTTRSVQSRAEFDVRFLFFTAYSYEHTNAEQWTGNCLASIDARTVTNSKRQEVEGKQTASGFVVRNADGSETLPDCVMTFAYWNPAFLSQSQLLNPQTGEFLSVDVARLPADSLTVRGVRQEAEAYKVTAKDTEVSVWYSRDQEWLALESTARGGRIIRYELI
jgi:Domain of unknown function (DUF6134)